MTEARRAGLVAAWLLAALALPAAPLSAPGMAQEEARALAIGYLQIADDPRYEPRRGYTGLSLKDLERPVDGARRAIRGSRALARALQIDFALEEAEAETGEELVAVMTRMLRERDVRLFLLDAPAEVLKAAAAALGAEPALLFNITETADSLRGADCGARLMHVMPSRAMLSDALAQYLVAKDWKRVLLLKGPLPEDEVLAGAFVRSAGKFGVRIVASRDFVPGQDPRERDRNNIVLLTTAPEHDVIFLADSEGEFARYVPYQSRQPRPVVGSEGLTASAWHWTWRAAHAGHRLGRLGRGQGHRGSGRADRLDRGRGPGRLPAGSRALARRLQGHAGQLPGLEQSAAPADPAAQLQRRRRAGAPARLPAPQREHGHPGHGRSGERLPLLRRDGATGAYFQI
jgi:ABC transporter substrate binding protein (PQQ-dependent alcohol dehydrogenase system)